MQRIKYITLYLYMSRSLTGGISKCLTRRRPWLAYSTCDYYEWCYYEWYLLNWMLMWCIFNENNKCTHMQILNISSCMTAYNICGHWACNKAIYTIALHQCMTTLSNLCKLLFLNCNWAMGTSDHAMHAGENTCTPVHLYTCPPVYTLVYRLISL